MARVQMKGDGRKAKNPKQTLKRLMAYLGAYKTTLLLVVVCILLSALATVAGSKSLEHVVDDYITPMLASQSPDYGPLLKFLIRLACIFLAGIVSSFLYNFLMVRVAQGVQKDVRDKLFSNMQRLPIRYFDTHTHGDLMSRYTNDIDTLRQMISQSIPQCISSVVTIVTVFVAMLITSPILTGVVVLTLVGILLATVFIGGSSRKYFVNQQKARGAVNGYIEETIQGQKVVKAFCHERTAEREFGTLNVALCGNAY